MKKTVFYLMLFAFIMTGTMMTNARKTKEVPSVEATNQSDYYKLTGSIGQYPIVMYLNPFANKGSYCGYYYYRSRPNTKFKLVAKAVKSRSSSIELTLYEYTPKGNHSGSFVGTVYGEYGCVFSGTFYNSKGQSFHFKVEDD